VVRLSLANAELDDALELDPDKGVEQGGEARRIAEVPAGEVPAAAPPGRSGPTDRTVALGAPLVALVATIALLGVMVFWGTSRSNSALPWLAVPVALYALAGFLALRAWSRPSA
jgi:hypothetical protein